MVTSFILLAAEATEHGAADHGPTLLGLGAEGWVYAGITLFFLIAIFGAKAHLKVLAALDAQIAETRKSLDEAEAIRSEAEALLANAKRQQAAAAKDAKALIDHAAVEANAIVTKAEADTKALIKRREKMAADKIEAAERAALDELRGKAAAAAAGAARELIAAQHDAKADTGLIDQAIAGI